MPEERPDSGGDGGREALSIGPARGRGEEGAQMQGGEGRGRRRRAPAPVRRQQRRWGGSQGLLGLEGAHRNQGSSL